MSDYEVRVLDSAALLEWRAGVAGAEAQAAKARTLGWWPLRVQADGQFSWLCPGCGYFSHGRLGDEAVGGWENPCWVRTGPEDAPTLAPSLGCPRWRDGTCVGHWWLRDGKLVPA